MLTAVEAAPPVTLVTGPEELLAERAVSDLVERARAVDPSADLRRLPGPELEPALLRELTSPSLFGDSTILVVDLVHEMTSEAASAVAALVRAPADLVWLVLVHSGQSNRAKAVLDACRETRAATV